MSRNLYILAGTLIFFSLVSFSLMWLPSSYQPGLPGNGSLWKTSGLFLMLGGLVVALAASLTALFEQLERRAEERRRRSDSVARGTVREFPVARISPRFGARPRPPKSERSTPRDFPKP